MTDHGGLKASFVRTVGDRDRIYVVRSDGSEVNWAFPSYGDSLPHDLIHLVVEAAFGLAQGFWGRVDAGADPAAITADANRRGGRNKYSGFGTALSELQLAKRSPIRVARRRALHRVPAREHHRRLSGGGACGAGASHDGAHGPGACGLETTGIPVARLQSEGGGSSGLRRPGHIWDLRAALEGRSHRCSGMTDPSELRTLRRLVADVAKARV